MTAGPADRRLRQDYSKHRKSAIDPSAEIIVVGAGTCGCLLTHELVSRFGIRVTLVEPPSAPAPAIDRRRPARWLRLLDSSENYGWAADGGAAMAARHMAWPRGRGIGGSSRINAMIWLPPTASDLHMLSRVGGPGWDVAAWQGAVAAVERLVRPERPRWLSEASRRFLAAASTHPQATTPAPFRRFNRHGRRWHAGDLLRGLPPEKLRVIRGQVDRLTWDKETVTGVRLRSDHGQACVHAPAGVVLAAGTIGTPTLLMRSGVGQPDLLGEAGIATRVESAGVGQGLQDHLVMPLIFAIPDRNRFANESNPRDLVRWETLGTGPLASNLAEAGGFFCDERFQIFATPTHYLQHPRDDAPAAMTLAVSVTRPRSRGMVGLRSADPRDAPRISAGYAAEPEDLEAMVAGVKIVRHIATLPPLSGWLGEERIPGARRDSAAELARTIGRYAQSLYHPIGTCAMGAVDACTGGGDRRGDGPAPSHQTQTPPHQTQTPSHQTPPHRYPPVVGTDLRVRGTDRLWVVDASVLPQVTAGNPSVTLLALARLAAGRIHAQLSLVPNRLSK